jgi:hypothetical protein
MRARSRRTSSAAVADRSRRAALRFAARARSADRRLVDDHRAAPARARARSRCEWLWRERRPGMTGLAARSSRARSRASPTRSPRRSRARSAARRGVSGARRAR